MRCCKVGVTFPSFRYSLVGGSIWSNLLHFPALAIEEQTDHVAYPNCQWEMPQIRDSLQKSDSPTVSPSFMKLFGSANIIVLLDCLQWIIVNIMSNYYTSQGCSCKVKKRVNSVFSLQRPLLHIQKKSQNATFLPLKEWLTNTSLNLLINWVWRWIWNHNTSTNTFNPRLIQLEISQVFAHSLVPKRFFFK